MTLFVPSSDALIERIPMLARAAAACLLLCGALLWVVHGRATILREGTEVRLRTAPVDPRDFFRGDYVVLSYEISTVAPESPAAADALKRGQPVFVRLRRAADGFAEAVSAAAARPEPAAGEVVIAGRVVAAGICATTAAGGTDCAQPRRFVRVAYGLENYFVPQGQGRAIERTEPARIEVVAAVAASGQAAIKRLLIDGQVLHTEPPY